MFIIRTFCAVIPMFMIWLYVKDFQTWSTQKIRSRVGFALGLVWAILFGAFTGVTGFLH